MKKMLKPGFIVLAVMLLASMILISCGGPADSPKPAVPASPAVASPKPAAPPVAPPPAPPPVTVAPPTQLPAPVAPPQPALTGTYGGILKIVNTGSVHNMGTPALINNPNDNRYAAPVMEFLIRIDTEGKYHPWLATDWKIASDKKSVTFNLRKGVKYHDGTDFNAQSVKDCLDIARTGEFANLKSIKSVDVVDEYSVKLNMDQFDWGIMSSLGFASVGWMASPTSLKKNDKEWSMTHPIGTGPFKFVEYKRDQLVKYEKNPNYWQQGKPYLDGVEYVIMANPTTALMSFKAGEAQVLAVPQPKDVADLKKAGFEVIIARGSVQCLFVDSANADSPFADVRVRQAFTHAIDTKALATNIGYGLFDPANQPFPAGFWANSPKVTGYPYNPTKAKELLTQAGYPTGFKTKYTMVAGSPQDTALAIQDYVKQVGIQMAIESVALPKFSAMAPTGWEGILPGGSPGRGLDPGHSFSNGVVSMGTTWVSTKRVPEVESLVKFANAELDPLKRADLFVELNRLMVDVNCMNIYYITNKDIYANSTKLKGLQQDKYTWWIFADAYLSK